MDTSELLEWRDHDANSEITYTGFGPYMVETLAEDSFRIWLPDDAKNATIMVDGFKSRKDARSACQSNVEGRRNLSRAISGDAVSLEAALGREEASVEYWWSRAKNAEAALKPSQQIADEVLAWMVRHDLLDAGNEYGASDVLEVLSDLVPTPHRDTRMTNLDRHIETSPSPQKLDLAEAARIDSLRLTAFRTNDQADRQAYFDATSKWFQDRHYRAQPLPSKGDGE